MPTAGRDGKAEYGAARVPGALFFDVDGVTDVSSSLPHMLPPAAAFAAAMDALGISNDDTGARTAREGARVSRTPPAAVRPSSTPPRARSRVL